MSQFRKMPVVVTDLSNVPPSGNDVCVKKCRIVFVSDVTTYVKKTGGSGALFNVVLADAGALADLVVYTDRLHATFKAQEFEIVQVAHLGAKAKDADAIKHGMCRSPNILWGGPKTTVDFLGIKDDAIPLGTGDIPPAWENDEARKAELIRDLTESPSIQRSATAQVVRPCPDGCSAPTTAVCRKTGKPHVNTPTCAMCGLEINDDEPFCAHPSRAGMKCVTTAEAEGLNKKRPRDDHP